MSKRAASAFFARFAIAILVMAALAPTVSRALALARGDVGPFAIVCTTGGAAFKRDGGTSEPMPAYDCPACLIAARDIIEPPPLAEPAALLRRDLRHVLAPPPAASTRAVPRLTDGSPRGPPALV